VQNIVEVDDTAQQTVYFAGNVTSGSQQFEYDAVYRLIHATGREQPGQVGYATGPDGYPEAPFSSIPHQNDLQALLAYTEDYSYDAVGNLLSTLHKAAGAGWTRTQTYVPGTNRIDTVSVPGDAPTGPYSGAFQHDPDGHALKTPNLASLTWDHAGRLVSADLGGGGTIYFTYDAAGGRTRKLVVRSGQILERLYLGGYERYRKRSGTAIPGSTVSLERETLHISDGTRRFAIVETKTADESVPNFVPSPLFRLQFPNHLDSACLEMDQGGAIISYEEYYPYGGSSFRAGDVDKRYRFAGKERDEETGLYFFGARYYAPWIARWLGPDPHAGASPASTPYGYAGGNPISRSDPDGQDDAPQPWLAGRYPVSQPAPPGSPAGTPRTLGSPYRVPAGGIVVDPLEAVARVHGGTVSRLENLSREYWGLRHG
jgi:RHS repeat-associated protein